MQILNLNHRWHKRNHSPLRYLKWSVFAKIAWLLVLNYFRKRSILDVWQDSEYASRWHIGTWLIHQIVLLLKPSVVIVLPIIQNQSNPKIIPQKVFWDIHWQSIVDPKLNLWSVLWVGDARSIHKSIFIKNHYWNLKLSTVAFSSVIKCPP